MTSKILRNLLHQRPFQQIQLHTKDGRKRVIKQREETLLLKSQFFLGKRHSNRFELLRYEEIESVEVYSPREA